MPPGLCLAAVGLSLVFAACFAGLGFLDELSAVGTPVVKAGIADDTLRLEVELTAGTIPE